MSLLLYLWGTSPQHPLDRRLGKPQILSRRCEEDKNLALPGIEPRPFYNEENPLFVTSRLDIR
jgi:hypothetical protein